jgi:hypothetical protein
MNDKTKEPTTKPLISQSTIDAVRQLEGRTYEAGHYGSHQNTAGPDIPSRIYEPPPIQQAIDKLLAEQRKTNELLQRLVDAIPAPANLGIFANNPHSMENCLARIKAMGDGDKQP